MSGIWIVIVGFSILSTLTVVGLFFWSAVSEGRERQALDDLSLIEQTIDSALRTESIKPPEIVINEQLAKMYFPLQEYAKNVKVRHSIMGFLEIAISKLKHYKQAGPDVG